MIKRFVIIVFTVAFIASLASFAFSSEGKETKLAGKVSAIDAAAKSVTIKDDKGKETVVTGVDEKTLSGLKSGDTVECMYTVKGGKNVCASITKKPAAGY